MTLTHFVARTIISRPALFLIAGLFLILPAGQMASGARQDRPLAYVTLRDVTPNAGAIAAIDTTKNRIIATIPVGPGPNGMVVTSDGKRGYVANYGAFSGPMGQATTLSNTVSVLQLAPLTREKKRRRNRRARVLTTVTVGQGPLGMAITPDNSEVYVTNFGQDATLVPGAVEGKTVSVIETCSNKVVATILVGDLPAGIAISPDGKWAYVTTRRTNQVWVINTATYSVAGTIPVEIQPANVAFTPDGQRAYVTNFGSSSVSVIDTAKQTTVPVPDGTAIKVGNVPIGITISPDGKRAYVVNAFSSNVSVIDTATNTVVATIAAQTGAAPAGPRAVAITPDGDRAYVTNFLSNTVIEIDTATNTIADEISISGGPNWVTIPHAPKAQGGRKK